MAKSSSTNKRKRTEDGPPPSEEHQQPPKIVKSSDLWLKEGNIVIRTSSPAPPDGSHLTQTLYKVHQSVLSLNSQFFEGMFGLDQGAFAAASEQFEGVPIMDLPDIPDDIGFVLRSLYFPMYVVHPLLYN